MVYPTISRRWKTRWNGWIFGLAALVGLALCVWFPRHLGVVVAHTRACKCTLAVVVLMALYRPARDTAQELMRLLRRPDRRRRRLAIIVGVVSGLYLYGAASWNNRPLVPRLLDEKAYSLQAKMLSEGMLFRAAHPKQEFFETFYVFDHPYYGAKYFPGTALMYAPAVWLGMPNWLTSLFIASFVSGMTCLVTIELFDGEGAAGVIASILLLATDSIHDMGTWVLAHEPVMLCVLVMIYAWLRWRMHEAAGWALLMGAAAGWAAITRPIDALVYALPMGILIVVDLIYIDPEIPRKRVALDLLLAVLAAAPFLGLQGWFDHKMTGHVFETPYRAYIDLYQPGDAYGGIGSDKVPQTTLQQKLDYYYDFILPLVKNYRKLGAWREFVVSRLPHILKHGMANPLQLLLIPAGLLLVLLDRRLLVVALPLPLFALLYVPNCSFFWYYPVIIAPALAILTIAGAMALSKWLPWTTVLFPLCALGIAIASYPELSGYFQTDQNTIAPAPAEQAVMDHVRAPALVFFTYHSSKMGFHSEPVYNLVTGWPDDEPITRAQDLGAAKDAELIAYYAKLQPDRQVYVVDRDSCAVKSLGKARDAAVAGMAQ